jgi:hypothetical protein
LPKTSPAAIAICHRSGLASDHCLVLSAVLPVLITIGYCQSPKTAVSPPNYHTKTQFCLITCGF